MLKLIICGGRNYRLTEHDYNNLDLIHDQFKVVEVVSGGCAGADIYGEAWAREKGIPIRQFIPEWAKAGRKAGPLRNQEMAEYADACIAFPGGKGTQDMINRFRITVGDGYLWDFSDHYEAKQQPASAEKEEG